MYAHSISLNGDAQDHALSILYGINFGYTANGGAGSARALYIPATYTHGLYSLAPTYLGAAVTVADEQSINTGVADDDYFMLKAVDNDDQSLVECARLKGAAEPHFLMERARFGTTAHAADAGHRGMMYVVEGGAGVPDKLYMVGKNTADAYEAILVATGS
jgi:hypothetical protein